MSHYRVAVFADDPMDFDRLLKPYSEVDKRYQVFHALTDDELDYYKRQYKKYGDQNESFENYLKTMHVVRENDKLGYYHNPNARYDWYTLDGGLGEFDFKEGHSFDDEGNARKNDFEFQQGLNMYKQKRVWLQKKKLAEQQLPKNATVDQISDHSDAVYFMEYYPEVTSYMLHSEWLYPYAFVTPDGVWHAPGKVGWFAASDDTPESRDAYLAEWIAWIQSDANPYVNFVDCHI